MLRNLLIFSIIAGFAISFAGCVQNSENKNHNSLDSTTMALKQKVDSYVQFKLTTDLSVLTENEKLMLPILFQISQLIDDIYWQEAYGGKEEILNKAANDIQKQYIKINYGPWDRLNGNAPFLPGYGEKPLGANFYPQDMTKEEFEAFNDDSKLSQYTLIRRKGNQLESIPYHVAFAEKIQKAAELLKKAAGLAEDEGLKKYLNLRAEAFLTDDYFASDMAWMDMKTNTIDFVVGPIENYEDALFGAKSAHEAYILIKDKNWSERLAKYASMLPDLQKGLPVDAKYKAEVPGKNSDLGAYDVIYYAGDCNAGSKTIAINLPNDEKVQLAKGSRRLQLKNAMKAKFDNILIPISDVLISANQRQHIKFDAFFANTMFHEVAHGLGIKNTIDGKGTVRDALKEKYSALEEGKADILGLYMVTRLNEQGELQGDLMDNYVTFMASIFRSIRFGASSAHGKANLLRFNYFKEKEAFTKNEDGTYSIDFTKMQEAMNSLSNLILTIQGDGDYERVTKLMEEKAVIGEELQKDLDKLQEKNIPIDVVWEQGLSVIGL
ncbi:MAG: Zn-dependent hydrolase [Chlorobi bacterium]|nr:Zn-dependent hydrolase [Chlorobiota bacterium]